MNGWWFTAALLFLILGPFHFAGADENHEVMTAKGLVDVKAKIAETITITDDVDARLNDPDR